MMKPAALVALTAMISGAPAAGQTLTFNACHEDFGAVGINCPSCPGDANQNWWERPAVMGVKEADGTWTIDLSGTGMADGDAYKLLAGTAADAMGVLPNTESGTDACTNNYDDRMWLGGSTSIITLGCLDSGECPSVPSQAPATVSFKVKQCSDTYAHVGLKYTQPGAWWEREPVMMDQAITGGTTYHSYTMDNTMAAGVAYKYYTKSDAVGAEWKVMANIESGRDDCAGANDDRLIGVGGWGNGNDNKMDDVEGCMDNGECAPAPVAQPATFTFTYNACKAVDTVSYRLDNMPGDQGKNWWERAPIPAVAVVGQENVWSLEFPNAATGDWFPSSDVKYTVHIGAAGEKPDIAADKAAVVGANGNCHAQHNEYTVKREWNEPVDMWGCPADNVCPSFAPYVAPPTTFTFSFNACHHDGVVGYRIDDSPGDGEWWAREPIAAVRGEGNMYTLTFPNAATGDYVPKMDAKYKITVNGAETDVPVDRSAQGGHGHANCLAQWNEYTLDSSQNSWTEPMDVNGCPETDTCDHMQPPTVKTGVLGGMFVGYAYTDATTQVPNVIADATGCMAACATVNANQAGSCGFWTYDYKAGTCNYGAGKENPMPQDALWFSRNVDAVSGPPSLAVENALAVAKEGCYASNSIYQGQDFGACGWAGLSHGTSVYVGTQATVDERQGQAWMMGQVAVEKIETPEACQAKCDAENARPVEDGAIAGAGNGQPHCDFFEWGGTTGAEAFFCYLKTTNGCTGEHISLKPGSVVGPAVCDGTVIGQVAVEEVTDAPPTEDDVTKDPLEPLQTTCDVAVADWTDAEGFRGTECAVFKCAAVVALFDAMTCDQFCTEQGLACVAAWDDVEDEYCTITSLSQIKKCDFDFGAAAIPTSDAVCMCGVGQIPSAITEGIDGAFAVTGSLAVLVAAVVAAVAF